MKTWRQIAEDQIGRAKAHPPAVAIELLANALRMKAIELDANVQARLADARGELGAALGQVIPSDDKIIVEHIRAAHDLLGAVIQGARA